MILCFGLFLSAVAAAVLLGKSVLWALGFGLGLFFFLGLRRGFSVRALLSMAWKKGREAMRMVPVFLLIGVVTGLWRASGTVSFFLYHGLRSMPPDLFVPCAFLLSAALSFVMGSSFGVCGTAGVVLMALARGGGVSVSLTAGAVLSGAYFGDRCSPMSSCAMLVASCTGTELYRNVREMLRTAVLPTGLTLAVYVALSQANPLRTMDDTVLQALRSSFDLRWPAVIPAAVLLAMALARLLIRWAMAASGVTAFVTAVAMQHLSCTAALHAALLGYAPPSGALSRLLSGGGAVSMVFCAVLVLVTSLYAGVLEGIGALTPLRRGARYLAERLGLFPAMLAVSTLIAAIFCNQSVVVIMDEQLLAQSYADRGASRLELAMDIENSGVTIASLVPWSIALAVPLRMLGAGLGAVPYAVLLYMIPLCFLPTKRYFAPAWRNASRAPVRRP